VRQRASKGMSLVVLHTPTTIPTNQYKEEPIEFILMIVASLP